MSLNAGLATDSELMYILPCFMHFFMEAEWTNLSIEHWYLGGVVVPPHQIKKQVGYGQCVQVPSRKRAPPVRIAHNHL